MICTFCNTETEGMPRILIQEPGKPDDCAHLCCSYKFLEREVSNTAMCFSVAGQNLTVAQAFERTIGLKCSHKLK